MYPTDSMAFGTLLALGVLIIATVAYMVWARNNYK